MQFADHLCKHGDACMQDTPIIWHKFCVAQCGRNEASDPSQSAAGFAHNAVRNVLEGMHFECLTAVAQPWYLFSPTPF